MLAEAWSYVLAHPRQFSEALWTHIALSASALVIAITLAVPLGIWLAGRHRAALLAINAANIGRTLPSLAVLALMLPILGTGFAPALFALTLLVLPPILVNTYTAIRQVDADVVDAARGMGMTAMDLIRKIKLPIALPVVFAGIRIAAIQVISGAVLASYIGGGGLGDFITAGIAMMVVPQLLVGAVPATLLALSADLLLGRLQHVATPLGLRTA